jgi:hypothetical protein
MKVLVIAAALSASSVAYAQAPGDVEPSEDAVAAPGMAPVVVVAAPAPVRRWSVGVGVGGLELAPHQAPDDTTSFDIGTIAVRYRAWRHLEIELAFAGGNESDNANGYNADREISEAVLALRYRFNPHHHWNWWLMAGMGTLAITRKDATDDEREESNKSTLQFGVGIEHRWTQFALAFEARAVGVKRDEDDDGVVVDAANGMDPAMTTQSRDGWAGGQFVFSGNYYF